MMPLFAPWMCPLWGAMLHGGLDILHGFEPYVRPLLVAFFLWPLRQRLPWLVEQMVEMLREMLQNTGKIKATTKSVEWVRAENRLMSAVSARVEQVGQVSEKDAGPIENVRFFPRKKRPKDEEPV